MISAIIEFELKVIKTIDVEVISATIITTIVPIGCFDVRNLLYPNCQINVPYFYLGG